MTQLRSDPPPEIEPLAGEGPPVLPAASRVLGGLFRVASSFLAVGLLFTAVGWIRAQAYFGMFGVPWIADELPIGVLASFSLWPIALLAIFLLTAVVDLAEGLAVAKLASVCRWALLGAGVCVAFSLTFTLFGAWRPLLWARSLSAIGWAVGCGAAGAVLIDALRQHAFTWTPKLLWLSAWVLIGGLYFVPQALGRCDGARDRDPNTTHLVPVRLLADSTEWRLLVPWPDHVAIVRLSPPHRIEAIRVVDRRDIEVTPRGK